MYVSVLEGGLGELLGVDGSWLPLPTRPQQYCDPRSLVFFFAEITKKLSKRMDGPTPEERLCCLALFKSKVSSGWSTTKENTTLNAATPSKPAMPNQSSPASLTSLFDNSSLPDLFNVSQFFNVGANSVPAIVASTASSDDCGSKVKKCLQFEYSDFDQRQNVITSANEVMDSSRNEITQQEVSSSITLSLGSSLPLYTSPSKYLKLSTVVFAEDKTLTLTPCMSKKLFKVPFGAKPDLKSPIVSQISLEVGSLASGKRTSHVANGSSSMDTQYLLNVSLDSNASLQTIQGQLQKTMQENVCEPGKEEDFAQVQREKDHMRQRRVEKLVEDAKFDLVDNSTLEGNSGPFFGLNLNVKHLLLQHRKITKLYKW